MLLKDRVGGERVWWLLSDPQSLIALVVLTQATRLVGVISGAFSRCWVYLALGIIGNVRPIWFYFDVLLSWRREGCNMIWWLGISWSFTRLILLRHYLCYIRVKHVIFARPMRALGSQRWLIVGEGLRAGDLWAAWFKLLDILEDLLENLRLQGPLLSLAAWWATLSPVALTFDLGFNKVYFLSQLLVLLLHHDFRVFDFRRRAPTPLSLIMLSHLICRQVL